MKAVGYIRVSTEEQAREGYGLSAQEQAVRAYCQAQSWELVKVYCDAGRSGGSRRGRDALAQMLEDARAGKFERVVFWKLDRLARNLRDLLDICDGLERMAIGIVSIQEAIDTGTAAGRMVRSLMGAVAEFERDVIRDRIKMAMAEKRRQGELLGPLPLGYRRDDCGDIVLDSVTAPLVGELFRRYATGRVSFRDLARWASEVGLRSGEGNRLDRLSARKILSNISYTGQVADGDQLVKGTHPPIVDMATFAEAQKCMEERRHIGGSMVTYGREPYPLSSVSVCAHCRTGMLGQKASRNGTRYMRCSTAHRLGKSACQQPMVPANLLEAQMAAYVGGMRLPPEYLGAVVAELRRRQQPDFAAEARRLEREIERWRTLYVMGEIEAARLRREIAPLRQRLTEVDRPREVVDVERAAGLLRDVGALWAESPRHLQREFVQEVFSGLVVEGSQLAAITPKAIYAPLFALDRQVRFSGEFGRIKAWCKLAPRAGLEPAT